MATALKASYTQGMKTAVSIPNDLFAEADAYAKAHDLSRSELYSRALADYLARYEPGAITRALNAIDWDDPEIAAETRIITEHSARMMRRVEW